jgi:hypothetical protein
MIDPRFEKLLSLTQAAKLVPGGGVHLSTLHRWRLRGVKGVRFETVLVGGKRLTSQEAIERFIKRTTAAADGQQVSSSGPTKSRERSIAEAAALLDREGI